MSISFNKQAEIYSQLAVMLESGLPVHTILQTLLRVERNKGSRTILTKTQRLIQSGKSIQHAMSAGGLVTDPLFLQLIEIGEQTGNLADSFQQISLTLEEQLEFRSRLVQAMTYPAVVLFVAIIVIFAMILVVVPSFADIYKTMGADLPGLTRVILDINIMVSSTGFWLVLGLFIIGFFLAKQSIGPLLIRFLAVIAYRLPVIGETLLSIRNYEFCVSLSMLSSARIPLLRSLNLIVRHTKDPVWKAQLKPLSTGVETGKRLSESMAGSELVSPLIRQMILVGEETAELADLMKKTAAIFKRHTDTRLKVMIGLVEPALIVFLGLIVSLILVAVYLPLFSTMGNFGN